MKNGESTPVQIERPIYKIEELNRDHLYEKPYSTRKYAQVVQPFLKDLIVMPKNFK